VSTCAWSSRLRANSSEPIWRAPFLNWSAAWKRVIDFFDKHDEGTNVAIAQAGAGIVALELIDQPARIIDPDVQSIISGAQKCR